MRAELSENRKPKKQVGLKGAKLVSAAKQPHVAVQKPSNPKPKPSVTNSRAGAKPKAKPQVLAKAAKPTKKAAPKAASKDGLKSSRDKASSGATTKQANTKISGTVKVTVTPKQSTKAPKQPVEKSAAKKPAASKKIAVSSKRKPRGTVKTNFATIVSAPPIPPELPRRQFSTGAMRAFDQAIKVFNRRQFEDAKPMFEALLSKFQSDVEIAARSQMYIQVCTQKMVSRPATPRNADELYDRGVFALNIGDFSQARSFFEKALRLKPDEPHLLYSLAATHAQSGAHDQALDYLKRSIQVQPRLRSQAFSDADFSALRENKKFLELIGLASPFDLLESRR